MNAKRNEQKEKRWYLRWSFWRPPFVALVIVVGVWKAVHFLSPADMDRGHIWNFALNLSGLAIGIYAAIEAASAAAKAKRAEDKAKESLDELKKTALILGESTDNFGTIFEEYLLQPLRSYENIPVKAHLLLSSPAYGYPVLGDGRFEDFYKALGSVKRGSEIELILFSPDAHLHHWANTLLWASTNGKRITSGGNGAKFAKDFGSRIIKFLQWLQVTPKTWRLWLTNETTLRLFAYQEIGNAAAARNDEAKVRKVYLVLTDRVTMPVNQWVAKTDHSKTSGFRGRGFPALAPLAHELAGESESHFEQMKRCPYSMLEGEEVGLASDKPAPEKIQMLRFLRYDYVFGRTEQHIFDFDCFQYELQRFLRELIRETGKKSEDQASLLKEVTTTVADYFAHFIREADADVGPYMGQLIILAAVADRMPHAELKDAIGNKFPSFKGIKFEDICPSLDQPQTDLGQFVSTFCQSSQNTREWSRLETLFSTDERTKHNIALKLLDVRESCVSKHKDTESVEFHNLELMLYCLLSSGFRESAYAAACRKRIKLGGHPVSSAPISAHDVGVPMAKEKPVPPTNSNTSDSGKGEGTSSG